MCETNRTETWRTSPADDFETSAAAVGDIVSFVGAIAQASKFSASKLKIYDPFYCAGNVRGHWLTNGFPNFINECEDFYEVMKSRRVPQHDVLVTNPPYSGDHIQRIFHFAIKNIRNHSTNANTADPPRKRKKNKTASRNNIHMIEKPGTCKAFALLVPSHVLASTWFQDFEAQSTLPSLLFIAPTKQRYNFSCPFQGIL